MENQPKHLMHCVFLSKDILRPIALCLTQLLKRKPAPSQCSLPKLASNKVKKTVSNGLFRIATSCLVTGNLFCCVHTFSACSWRNLSNCAICLSRVCQICQIVLSASRPQFTSSWYHFLHNNTVSSSQRPFLNAISCASNYSINKAPRM